MFTSRFILNRFVFPAVSVTQHDITHWKPHLFADRDRFVRFLAAAALDAIEHNWHTCTRNPTPFAKLVSAMVAELRKGIERGWYIITDVFTARGEFLYTKAVILSDHGLLGAIHPHLDKVTKLPLDDEPTISTRTIRPRSHSPRSES